jgi:hypothetical protein
MVWSWQSEIRITRFEPRDLEPKPQSKRSWLDGEVLVLGYCVHSHMSHSEKDRPLHFDVATLAVRIMS